MTLPSEGAPTTVGGLSPADDRRPSIKSLLRNGDIRRCAACNELSAYDWANTTQKDTTLRGGFEPDEVAHIAAADAFGWQCGHCRAYNAFRDAPTLAECYTHQRAPPYSPVPHHARYASLRPSTR